MTEYALSLSEVSSRGVRSASLALLPGEIAGVVGPQGSGKSSLLRVAAGCLARRTGEVRVFGLPVSGRAARHLIGFAGEAPAFPPAVTVRALLDYYARLHTSGPRRRQFVRDALDRSGLSAAADLQADGLTKPDLQRLALAQAVLGGRRVLVLDEILCGLDAFARRDLRSRVAALAASGTAVLISARDPVALERLASRVLVLRDGRIVRAGPLAALLAERVLEVILDAPPPVPPPGFRVTATGIETPLTGRTAESALALCRAHRLPVRASRVRVKTLEDVVLDPHDAS